MKGHSIYRNRQGTECVIYEHPELGKLEIELPLEGSPWKLMALNQDAWRARVTEC